MAEKLKDFSLVVEKRGSELAKLIKSKPWAQKVMSKFGKIGDENERRASMSEEREDPSVEEEKKEDDNLMMK
jgi:hypothetical protein